MKCRVCDGPAVRLDSGDWHCAVCATVRPPFTPPPMPHPFVVYDKPPSERAGSRLKRIGNRDGWICWLCKLPVDPNLPVKDPMGPSVDHVIPRSHGGHATRGNLRLAHKNCNNLRGNRPYESARWESNPRPPA